MRQPNPWSCLPTSFAIIMKTKVEVIFAKLGHDGSEKIFPKLEEPYCRRSFHIQEMIDLAMKLNYYVTPIEGLPSYTVNDQKYELPILAEDRMAYYLENHNGVLTGLDGKGKRHAVAWSGYVIDPADGLIKDLDSINIQTFWIVSKNGRISSIS